MIVHKRRVMYGLRTEVPHQDKHKVRILPETENLSPEKIREN